MSSNLTTNLSPAEPAPLPSGTGPSLSATVIRKTSITYHVVMLLGALGILIAAALLRLDTGGKVEMPGTGPLPALCIWRQTLRMDCPGCGLTRSFVALAHGEWTASWRFNPAGWFLFAMVAYQIPYRGVQLWRLRRGRPEHAHHPLLIGTMAWGAVAALVVQWAVRMM